jgi:DNA-directed RNA polymerase subunit RPC12/RpoP
MALVALKCPNCGGTVQMEENMKDGFCVHCGTKIINEQNISGQVSIDKKSDIVNHLKVAKEALTEQNLETATKLIENILLMDYDCLDAWYMKALLSFKDKRAYDDLLIKTESKELNNYGIFSKEDIRNCWEEHTISFKIKKDISLRRMEVGIRVDNMESQSGTHKDIVVFGVKSGKHIVNVQMTGRSIEGIKVSAVDQISFVSTKDHEFIIKSGGIFAPKIKIVQIN